MSTSKYTEYRPVILLVRKFRFCYGDQRFMICSHDPARISCLQQMNPDHILILFHILTKLIYFLHSLILSQICSVYNILTFSNICYYHNIIIINTYCYNHQYNGFPTGLVHCVTKTQHSTNTMPSDDI
jgi:hypothetical protein